MTKFQVGQHWNRRDGARVTIDRLQPASVRVEHVGPHATANYAVDLEGRYGPHPTAYDLIDLAQSPPVCPECDGAGGVCLFCRGTGLSPRIYVAGPMSGIPNLNFPVFHAKAAELRAKGYVVINPAEINDGADELVAVAKMTSAEYADHWRKCMRKDITELCTCDGVAMLEGWTRSKGAMLEHHVAKALGLLVFEAGA